MACGLDAVLPDMERPPSPAFQQILEISFSQHFPQLSGKQQSMDC
jgi:hypothetical protein